MGQKKWHPLKRRQYNTKINCKTPEITFHFVWGALQQQVYHNRKFTTVDQLKQTIVQEWNKLSQRFMDRSIDEWRRRLTSVVQQQGGHIERI